MSHYRDYKRGLAKELSEPLDNMMNNGHMRESRTGTAVLDDIEVDVFVAFCEFAYKGSYTTPDIVVPETESPGEPLKPLKNGDAQNDAGDAHTHVHSHGVVAEPVSSPPPDIIEVENEVFDSWVTGHRGGKKKKKKTSSFVEWNEVPQPEPERVTERLWKSFKAQKVVEPSTPAPPDRSPVLTFHAKVYDFATRYLIQPLQDLSLSYLYHDMCQFPVTEENLWDIFDLVQYTYDHTNRDDPSGSLLRGLVAHYIASKADVLVHDDRMALISGEAGQDLVRLLVE
ncbi:hypothetical protein T310_2073 [Rasamsonia emersonii CBS 393.64]|uniref:BTB domain-containing protein n=1 Tax=Rasamsonia emersonii (strain ATCC 16479 / CBS 393.64 / IMI 116815) TaxID=1408163 RepID=A0A0F4Z058_RASE3|nr:hypothetical protein T310_2073 [Rasamsonia emersonii CBS 393.64]KKA23889.1 hypothetical protein T310_2073 [Rasamsonia emersonii CBS 393.64]